MNGLPITSLYAALLGILLLILSWGVVSIRRSREVSLGDAGHDDLRVAQRRQGNFIEYVPLGVILIGLVEASGGSAALVHGLGATFVAARVMHPFGLRVEFGMRAPRFVGTVLSWTVILVASLVLLSNQLM